MKLVIIAIYLVGLGFVGYLLDRIMDIEGINDEDYPLLWPFGTILWLLMFPILLGYGISRLFFK